ncbi:MAG: NUDIX domain-containing protein [Acidimicrobiia bacterium]
MNDRRPPRLSGDGFVQVADGSHRWGVFGAAGVLFRHRDGEGTAYFVAQRSHWTHQGGTWAVPGGALDEGETPLEGALREFGEEIGLLPDRYELAEVFVDDHGGWSYTTLVVDVPEPFPLPVSLHWETADVAWVDEGQLAELELFPAFRAALGHLGVL